MSKEVDELVDSVTNIGKYVIKRLIEAAHEVEHAVVPAHGVGPSQAQAANAGSSPLQGATSWQGVPPEPRQESVDFYLGEWRRFTPGGEAYQVVAPLRHVDGDWLMRIRLKDGTTAEYLLSHVRNDPPLTVSE